MWLFSLPMRLLRKETGLACIFKKGGPVDLWYNRAICIGEKR